MTTAKTDASGEVFHEMLAIYNVADRTGGSSFGIAWQIVREQLAFLESQGLDPCGGLAVAQCFWEALAARRRRPQ